MYIYHVCIPNGLLVVAEAVVGVAQKVAGLRLALDVVQLLEFVR